MAKAVRTDEAGPQVAIAASQPVAEPLSVTRSANGQDAATAKSGPTRKPSAKASRPAPKAAGVARPTPEPNRKEATMDTMEKTKDMIDDTSERTRTAVDKGQKMFGDMSEFSKGNLEAMVESSNIAARGMETMSQDAIAYAKTSFEDATAAAKKMASTKSPAELMKLQSDYVRASFDALVAQTSRSTEAMLKLAGEVAQPISNRVSLATDKVKAAA